MVNVDNPCLPLFVIMFYAYISREWIFYLLASWMFICTKEPCLVYFIFFEAGIWLYYGILFLKKKIKNCDHTAVAVHISTVLLAVFWLLYFLTPGRNSWVANLDSMVGGSGLHTFGFTFRNMVIKLQQIFMINFNWLPVAGAVAALFCKNVRAHIKANGAYYLPLAFAMLGVLVFNLFYFDYPHPRYIMPSEAILLLFTIPIFICIDGKKKSAAALGCLSVLLLVQSFVTVDPYTNFTYNSGESNSPIINSLKIMTNPGYDDGTFYNRESSYYIRLLEKALSETEYDGDSVVVFPKYENLPVMYGYETTFFWNKSTNKIQTNQTDSTIPIRIASEKKEISQDDRIIYLVPCFNDEDAAIKEQIHISSEGHTDYRTLSLNYYIGVPAAQ